MLRLRRSSPPTAVRPTWALILALLCLAVSTGALVWVGYRATSEWEHSAVLSADHRGDELLALLVAALEHDMRGAQASVLASFHHHSLRLGPPYDLADTFARAFARFPYPESFFAWAEKPLGGDVTYFFNRTDRKPAWDTVPAKPQPYPVVVLQDPYPVRAVVDEARRRAASGTWFVAFESLIAETPYQTVVHLLYDSRNPGHVVAMTGFMVNLSWVRDHYFEEILGQVRRIRGGSDPLRIAIIDDTGHTVAATGADLQLPIRSSRYFPLFFFDHEMFSSLPDERPRARRWRAVVGPAEPPSLFGVIGGARYALLLIGVAALVTIGGLGMTVQAARVAAQLSTMKTEFVATVTHDLKTPLALIRLVAETLAKRRFASSDKVVEYAGLLSAESDRLTRLIDNLLTYTRISDAKGLYRFEAVDVGDMVEDAVNQFRPRMADLGFGVDVRLEQDLPPVRADRQMMGHVIENLIDNALKYDKKGRALTIQACREGGRVAIQFTDRGEGIPGDELSRVFERFYRGSHVRERGSGLGLSIVHRVVRHHGGVTRIRSVVGEGTCVTVLLPEDRAV